MSNEAEVPSKDSAQDHHAGQENTGGFDLAEGHEDTADNPNASPDASYATPISHPAELSTADVPPSTNAPVDSRIAALLAIFPDFDPAVLESVLDSVGGDQDRAIDMLLGMSDPDYVPQQRPPPSQAPMSQTDLDEQFARQLMLQESEEQPRWNSRSQVPYQPRQNAPHGQPPRAGQGNDTLTEIQDQLSKFAESGKKTLGSLFAKVKSKIDEFDGPQTRQHGPGPSGSGDQWAGQSPSYYNPTPAPTPQPSSQGYQVDDRPIAIGRNIQPSAEPTDAVFPSNPPLAAYGNEPTPPPPRTVNTSKSGTPPIDPSKYGLLPKRPVSLLSPNPSTAPSQQDDDDDLEYAENPFDDRDARH